MSENIEIDTYYTDDSVNAYLRSIKFSILKAEEEKFIEKSIQKGHSKEQAKHL